MASRPWLLVYDADCSICRKFKDLAKRLDRGNRIEEAGLDDARIQAFAPGLKPREIPKNFHLILPGGRVATGEMALPELLSLFPGGALFAFVLRKMPGSRQLMFRLLKALAGT